MCFCSSQKTGCGLCYCFFVKSGKLPGKCESTVYGLFVDCFVLKKAKEYGNDIFEIQSDSIQPGQRVVVLDDLLATGGSFKAVQALVEKLGGVLLEFVAVIELTALKGRKNLEPHNVFSLIKYDD